MQLSFWLGAGTTYTSGTLATTWASQTNANRAVGQTNLAAATSNYWQVTGVQLEVGAVATPFEFETFSETLEKCQRYLETSYNIGTALGTGTSVGALYVGCSNAAALDSPVRFRVLKRATPTIRIYSTNPTLGEPLVSEYTENPQTFATNRVVTVFNTGMSGVAVRSAALFASGRFYEFHYYADSEF